MTEVKGYDPTDDERWPIVIRGEYEWDQANDPYMINKTIPVIVSNMEAPYCLSEHRDDWGLLHLCIRAHGHTGRHYASNYGGHYVTAVWK